MHRSLPFGDRLPWVLFAVSAALAAWGYLAGSGGLVTLGGVGIGLSLLAYGIVPRLLGHAEEDAPPRDDDDG